MADDKEHVRPDRRMRRQNVLLGAKISGFGDGSPTNHRIRDLSASGARIDRASALRTGATVLVSVGVLETVGATVVWVQEDIAGLKFAELIDPDAARSKAIVAPGKHRNFDQQGAAGTRPDPALRAGWISELNSPYRRDQ